MDDIKTGESGEMRGTTRRAVLRMVGHAAWAAPVIAVASTAPAYAVGSPTGAIEVTNAAGTAGTSPTENKNLAGLLVTSLTGAVRNVGTVNVLSPITIVVQFPLLDAGLAWSLAGTGWSFSGGNVITVSGQLTLVWTGGTLAPNTATPGFTLTPLVSVGVGTITASATAQDTFGHNLSNSDTFV